MESRLLFDISTSMRWFGPPVGIVRVERELAKRAMQHHPNCRYVFFDPDLQLYREVRPRFLQAILDGAIAVDTTGMKDPSRSRPRKTDRVPRFLLTPFLWLTQSRRMMLRTLGGMMLLSKSAFVRKLIRAIQPVIAGQKYRDLLIRTDGSLRGLAPVRVLTGAPLPLERNDVILFAGANWMHSDAGLVGQWGSSIGVRLVSLCYDVIPLLFPQFFKPKDVVVLRRHFDRVFAVASLNLVSCKIVARDIERYCAEQAIAVGPIKQIPYGFDLPASDNGAVAPEQSKLPARYIMLVSTIEPRKGHGLVHAVWSRLLAEGIPQKLDITLVLVGRPGWLVDDLIKTLRSTERILVADNANDAALTRFYDRAEFCIYPSEYEGYGLPVIEALARGKAVLASDVGVVPELTSGLLRQLPPANEQLWYEAIREWLVNPAAVPKPDASGFRHPTWQEAAAQVFAAIGDLNALETPTRAAAVRATGSDGSAKAAPCP